MKFSEMPYTRTDAEQVKKEYEELIHRVNEAKSGEEVWAAHQEKYKIDDHVMTNMTLSEIRHGANTQDTYYEQEKEFYDDFMPVFEGLTNAYNKALFESPYRTYMEEKIGKVAFKNMEIAMKSFDDKIVPLMQEENSLITRYDKLIADAAIRFRGEEYNLSLMMPFYTCNDRATRKEAWDAISAWFMTVTEEIDDIYDKMVKNRTEQARQLGYENYVELGYYRMGRNCYDRDMVENFRKQVKESFVPFVNEINEKRRQRIGVDSLKLYDQGVFFKEGNPELCGTPEETMQSGLEMYKELSPETQEFMQFMMDHELFDVFGRKHKQQGGYMTYLPDFKSPFIFGNFTGTQDDVGLITHECGHAFQGYLMREEPIREYLEIGMETAEIHSMSMEYFTYQWMDKFFGDRKADYLSLHFEDSAIFIPYGCMVDEFQHIMYEKPELSPLERKQVWKELEKTYRPYLGFEDPFFGEGGYWQRQGHIFQVPFYYIDYVLAGICAMEFKVKMDRDFDSAWQDYLKLCRLSAKDFFVNMLKEVGLDDPFEDGSIEKLVEELRKIAL